MKCPFKDAFKIPYDFKIPEQINQLSILNMNPQMQDAKELQQTLVGLPTNTSEIRRAATVS